MYLARNSKSVMTVALFATLLITGACSGNKAISPNDDLSKMTAITEEKVPTAADIAAAKLAAAEAPSLAPQVTSQKQTQKDTPSTIAGLDELLSLGKYMGVEGAIVSRVGRAVWKLIEKNQAVVNLGSHNLSILPDNTRARQQLSGFQGPVLRAFSATLHNLAGFEVVRYDYLIQFFYGGNVNGKGKFIQNLTVIHRHVRVWPGFNLDAEFVTGNIMNAGRSAQDPIVAMPGEVRWKVKNVLTNVRKSNAFYVFGDGRMKIVSSDREVKTLH